jgi:hypothetical protein
MGYGIFYRVPDICSPGIYKIIQSCEEEKALRMVLKINN